MNQYKVANRVLAAVAFLVALLTYASTLQPSVPFWDCGEFSAATTWQQVPHPPGAPLWLITARLFQIFSFGDLGWRVNLAAGICSAFTAMLVYLIGVRLVERWHPFREGRSLMSYLPTFGGSLIAALAFTWSDSQWFNSVESEVYAGGTTLIALLVYLMMRWDQEAERPRHERYLLLMAYLLGLAIGVHLLALLVVPAIAMVIYFKRYRFTPVSFLVLMGVTGISFYFFIYQAPLKYIPRYLAAAPEVVVVLFVLLLGGLWWSVWSRRPLVFLPIASFLLIMLGFTTYTQVLLRANAHPAMNENQPDSFSGLVSYLGREQYESTPIWPRRWRSESSPTQDRYDSGTGGRWSPPVAEKSDGSPVFDHVNTAAELKFLWQFQVDRMYLRYFLWNFVGRVSDIQDAGPVFLSVDDAERSAFIHPTGYDGYFPIRFFALPLLLGLFGLYWQYRRDWRMAFVFTTLFLFLGVLAALQQNQQEPQPRERDYFYTGSFMIFCGWIGLGAVGLAELARRRGSSEADEPESDAPDADAPEIDGAIAAEPREGGVGMAGGVLALCLVAVPINMAVGGWKLHDRSGNWIPWDYSYNILQSCDKDAVLFTNGDNDTFPLWYLQDVAGIRRDVRVVNLSLGNTAWYVRQLKHERPWKALPVPIGFADSALAQEPNGGPGEFGYSFILPPVVTVDVPADVMARATGAKVAKAGTMSWTLHGAQIGDGAEELIRAQDKLIRSIIETNGWKRPIYFSTTVGPDSWGGLEEYFRWEGMAYRVMPVKQPQLHSADAIDPAVMRESLMKPLGADEFYGEPRRGFKFRNLADPDVFYLEDHRKLVYSYRLLFVTLATHELYNAGDRAAAVAVLDRLEQSISPDMFALSYPLSAQIAEIYRVAGARGKAEAYARRTIALIDDIGPDWAHDPAAREANPVDIKAQMLVALGDYDGAMRTIDALRKSYPDDPTLRARMEELRVEKMLARGDTAAAVLELRSIVAAYGDSAAPAMMNNRAAFQARLDELTLPGKPAVDTAAVSRADGTATPTAAPATKAASTKGASTKAPAPKASAPKAPAKKAPAREASSKGTSSKTTSPKTTPSSGTSSKATSPK